VEHLNSDCVRLFIWYITLFLWWWLRRSAMKHKFIKKNVSKYFEIVSSQHSRASWIFSHVKPPCINLNAIRWLKKSNVGFTGFPHKQVRKCHYIEFFFLLFEKYPNNKKHLFIFRHSVFSKEIRTSLCCLNTKERGLLQYGWWNKMFCLYICVFVLPPFEKTNLICTIFIYEP